MIVRSSRLRLEGWDVLDSLSDGRPRTAAQLEEDTGRDRRLIRAILRRLEAAEYVRRVGVLPKRGERPSTLWEATVRVQDLGAAPDPIQPRALDGQAVLDALDRLGVATAAEVVAEMAEHFVPLVESLLREAHAGGGRVWRAPDGRWVARTAEILPSEVV